MNKWKSRPLAEVIELQRGHDLPAQDRRAGDVPIIGSFGVTGTHDAAKYAGPGVAIGRSGAAFGTATFVSEAYWPLNTCLFVKDFKGNEPRWVFHLLDSMDFAAFNSGSAQPSLNRNFLRDIAVRVPPRAEQRAIAEVLGAFEDKIVANNNLAGAASALAGLVYDRAVATSATRTMSQILTPILGGTPSRANRLLWGGSHLWASAKDVTGANSGVIVDTEEKISDIAIAGTKSKPLPTGSVILTARGTVGAVARLARSSSFNQSCYGFAPGALPAGVLYFAVLRATERAKAFAHGSVFDTITMKTFDHLHIPDLSASDATSLEALVSPLLDTVTSVVRQNASLAATRHALLPQLISGKLRVRDAGVLLEGVL